MIPDWMRHDDYILSGCPMWTHSYKRSFRLWRCLHMETLNIQTHLLGCIASPRLASTCSIMRSPHRFSTCIWATSFPSPSPMASATICFGMSAIFHILRSRSYHPPLP